MKAFTLINLGDRRKRKAFMFVADFEIHRLATNPELKN